MFHRFVSGVAYTANILFHFASNLLWRAHPAQTNQAQAESTAISVCGIMRHAKDRALARVGLPALRIVGESLTKWVQQDELLDLLKDVHKETGWNIEDWESELLEVWGRRGSVSTRHTTDFNPSYFGPYHNLRRNDQSDAQLSHPLPDYKNSLKGSAVFDELGGVPLKPAKPGLLHHSVDGSFSKGSIALTKIKLGERSDFVYDKQLKKWINLKTPGLDTTNTKAASASHQDLLPVENTGSLPSHTIREKTVPEADPHWASAGGTSSEEVEDGEEPDTPHRMNKTIDSRQRVTLACAQCRKRKLRCDFATPRCRNCKNLGGLVCTIGWLRIIIRQRQPQMMMRRPVVFRADP